MLKFILSVIAMTIAVYPNGPVLKTGQTVINKVGDDGSYQTGIARSYIRDDINGTVTDNVTKLEWQDNTITNSMTMNSATTYCDELILDGNGNGKGAWRIPTPVEFTNIVDRGKSAPAVDTIFQNVTSSTYWVYYGIVNNQAAIIDLQSGVVSFSDRTDEYKVICVRNVP
jgi:hypothetical protein